MCSHSADEKPESTETGGDGGNTDATLEKIWEELFGEVKIYETEKASAYSGVEPTCAAENSRSD